MSTKIDARGYLESAYGLEVVGPGDTAGELEVRPITQEAKQEVFGDAARVPESAFLGTDIDQTVKIDATGLLNAAAEAEGITDAEFEISSPDNPISTPAIGLIDQIKMMKTGKPSEALKLLQDAGFEEVKFNKDTKQFVVKNKGVWQSAQSGVLSQLVAESPVIAASIAGGVAGSAKGATAGASLGPVGATVGGIAGGLVGGLGAATAARITDVSVAKAAGLRDDTDVHSLMEEVGSEFVDNLIFDGGVSAALAAFPAAKAIVKGAGKATGVNAFLKRNLVTALSDDIAEVMESFGMSRRATNALVKAAKKGGSGTNKIKNNIVDEIKFRREAVEGSSPLVKKVGNIASRSIENARQIMRRDYDVLDGILGSTPALNKTVQADDVVGSIRELMQTEGLIDDMGRIAKNAVGTDFPTADFNRFKKILQSVDGLGTKGKRSIIEGVSGPEPATKTSLKKLAEFVKEVDLYRKQAGAFRGADNAMSTNSQRILRGIREIAEGKLTKELTGEQVRLNPSAINKLRLGLEGRVTGARNTYDAGALRSLMKQRYSSTRNVLDEFATARFDRAKIGESILKESLKDSSATVDNFQDMLKLSGRGARDLDEIVDASAAYEYAGLINQSGAQELNWFQAFTNPVRTTQKIATSAGSPRQAVDAVMRLQRRQGFWGGVIGLNRDGLAVSSNIGNFVNHTLGITSNQTMMNQLMQNPEVFRLMFDQTKASVQQQQMLDQILIQEALGGGQ